MRIISILIGALTAGVAMYVRLALRICQKMMDFHDHSLAIRAHTLESSSKPSSSRHKAKDCTTTLVQIPQFLNIATKTVYESTVTQTTRVDCSGCKHLTTSDLFIGVGPVSCTRQIYAKMEVCERILISDILVDRSLTTVPTSTSTETICSRSPSWAWGTGWPVAWGSEGWYGDMAWADCWETINQAISWSGDWCW